MLPPSARVYHTAWRCIPQLTAPPLTAHMEHRKSNVFISWASLQQETGNCAKVEIGLLHLSQTVLGIDVVEFVHFHYTWLPMSVTWTIQPRLNA